MAKSRTAGPSNERDTTAVPVGTSLATYWADFNAARRQPTETTAISTGLDDVDRAFRYLPRDALILIASTPPVDKTAFVTHLAMNAALQPQSASGSEPAPRRRILLFSLDVRREELVPRMLSALSGVQCKAILDGGLDDIAAQKVRDASDRLAATDLLIDDTRGLSLTEFVNRARREALTTPLNLVVVDSLSDVRGFRDARVKDRAPLAQGLKALASALGCPVIAAASLGQGAHTRADKRPIMADLQKANGLVERHADLVACLYWRCLYFKNASEREVELVVVQCCNGAQPRRILLHFDRSCLALSPRWPAKAAT